MPQVYVNDNGTWKEAQEIYLRDADSWKLLNEVYVRNNGVWSKVYPNSPGRIVYSTAGNYSFIVPSGITSVKMFIYGAGGGSGAGNSFGDFFIGSGGGAGGLFTGTLAVTPNETLNLTVGQRGFGASFNFNGQYRYNPNNLTLGTGTGGGSSSVTRTNGLIVGLATGGARGVGGSTAYTGGAGGTPSVPNTTPPGGGGFGQGQSSIRLNDLGSITGGINGSGIPPSNVTRGTGYGNGGGQSYFFNPGVDGQDGAVIFEW
jgi:hypothetical protein